MKDILAMVGILKRFWLFSDTRFNGIPYMKTVC